MLLADLGGGLVLRHATVDDAAALSTFNAGMHADPGTPPDEGIRAWTRDLVERPHPTFRVADFTIVEDTSTRAIISSLNLIGQTWSYAGVPFGVGQVELVATDPAYRRTGLVRRQFDIVHRWSAERGQLIQVISGIPWYYRQFGYEYAIAMDGGRAGYRPHVPAPVAAADEPFRVRPATERDLPFIHITDARARTRYRVSAVRDAAVWRYELDGRSSRNALRRELRIIEAVDGTPSGFLAHWPVLWNGLAPVTACELTAGVSWLAAAPAVLRYLAAVGAAYAAEPGATPFDGFAFMLGDEHPMYRTIADRLPRVIPSYAWYVRVPDIAAFVRHIAPALEARLAASDAAGHTGELSLNFYRDGLRLEFEAGQLIKVTHWARPERHEAMAGFPDLTFLKLLFGYRSLDELLIAYPDCNVRGGEARPLLNALFPKQPSLVWPVG